MTQHRTSAGPCESSVCICALGDIGDQNVFDIQQGVAIGVFVKKASSGPVVVHQADLWGSQASKYHTLSVVTVSNIKWHTVRLRLPFYLFVLTDSTHEAEYVSAWKITNIFSVHHTGIITKRDRLTIRWTADDVLRTVREFVTLTPEAARQKYELPPDVRDWKVEWAQNDLRRAGLSRDRVFPIFYRPFDVRFSYFTGHSRGFVGWPVTEITRMMLHGDNVALVTTRMTKGEDFGHVLLSRQMIEVICLSSKTSNNAFIFPLYLDLNKADAPLLRAGKSDMQSDRRENNFKPDFIRNVAEWVGLKFTLERGDLIQTFGSVDLFYYIIAVLCSPSYRSRYKEFLRRDFPRIPIPGVPGLFRGLISKGGELVALHLMESPRSDDFITTYIGPEDPKVSRVGWSDDVVWLDAERTSTGEGGRAIEPGRIGFRGVPEEVWNFHIGGYQVCEKWLKDRKGRTLTAEDITHYHRIVIALHETIRIMREIDEVIEAHGGWPATDHLPEAVTA